MSFENTAQGVINTMETFEHRLTTCYKLKKKKRINSKCYLVLFLVVCIQSDYAQFVNTDKQQLIQEAPERDLPRQARKTLKLLLEHN